MFCSTSPVHSAAIVADTAIIIGANSHGPYWVSGFFILDGSETVTSNSQDTPGYVLDSDRGRIEFERALTSADTITVAFQRLGFALRSRWSSANSTESSTPLNVVPVSFTASSPITSSTIRAPEASPRLQWKGHKSFSVSASDGTSADWSQGMELAVEGELLQGLRLTAALSDRRVGGASGYSSRDGSRLGDLERFFIEAQSSRFYGRWGELRLHQTEASRSVAGLQTKITAREHSIETFIARPQGEPRRSRIALREGVFGPYSLSGDGSHANIVDGSQVVWLDGNRLAEGRDADYTLDAARGTITLSPRATFSSNSQLVIEYEESLDDYRRTLAGGAWAWRSSDSVVENSLSFAWEGDDPAQPLYGTLTEQQKGILASSPSGTVAIPASEFVGDRDGDYFLNVEPDGDTIFRYAGPDQGNWDVRFRWVGLGKGRYRHLIDNVYEYAGPALGSYEPTLVLNAPNAEAVIDESLCLTTRTVGSFAIDWQGIGVDPNRFSKGSSSSYSNHALAWGLGDSRGGKAGFSSLRWTRQDKRSPSRSFGLSLNSFGEMWRLPSTLLDERYDHLEFSGGLPVADWLSIRADAGRLFQPEIEGWRLGATAVAIPTRWLLFEERIHRRWLANSVSSRGESFAAQSTARAMAGIWNLEAGLRTEDVDDSTRMFTYAADAALARWVSISRDGLVARQEWRGSHDLLLDRRENNSELSLGLPAKYLGARSGSGLLALRGEQSIADQPGRPYYGGRLNSTWTPVEHLQISADVDLIHRQAGAQRETYIPTRPGQGDYRYERGEYIPDPHGDFRRVYVDDESESASAYDASKHVRVSWRPVWRDWRWSIDASRRIDARYDAREFAPGAWLAPWSELTDALLSGARLSTRDDHRVTVQPRRSSRATVSFVREYQLARAVDGTANDDQHFTRVEGEWREELDHAFYIALAGQFHRRQREGKALVAIDGDARALLFTIGHTPAAGIGLSLESRRRIDREFTADRRFGLWGVRPTARINRGSLSGSVSSDFTWLDTDASGPISPVLAEGRPLGFSFTEAAEIRWQLPARVSLHARVSGDHRPEEPDRWRMHLETVATF